MNWYKVIQRESGKTVSGLHVFPLLNVVCSLLLGRENSRKWEKRNSLKHHRLFCQCSLLSWLLFTNSLPGSPALDCHPVSLVTVRKGELGKQGRVPPKPDGTNPLTSLCSMQILQSHTGCGRLLEVSTPHLVQTFWGQNTAQATLRHARL